MSTSCEYERHSADWYKTEAERLISMFHFQVERGIDPLVCGYFLAEAQICATLAQTIATERLAEVSGRR